MTLGIGVTHRPLLQLQLPNGHTLERPYIPSTLAASSRAAPGAVEDTAGSVNLAAGKPSPGQSHDMLPLCAGAAGGGVAAGGAGGDGERAQRGPGAVQ